MSDKPFVAKLLDALKGIISTPSDVAAQGDCTPLHNSLTIHCCMTSSSPLHIGDLAAELGLNPRTIRYYERIGLMPEPQRTVSGYRLYNLGDFERLQFILKAKTIGLSLEEIGEVLSLRADHQPACQRVLAIVDDKIAAIDKQLRALQELRTDLIKVRGGATGASECDGTFCDIIEAHESRPAS